MLKSEQYTDARILFQDIIKNNTKNPDAFFGLISAQLGLNDITAAKETEKLIPSEIKNDNKIRAAVAQILLTEKTKSVGNIDDLQLLVKASPADYDVRFQLAIALISQGKESEAINTLLEIIRDAPNWQEGKAKIQLLELLDSLGDKSEEAKSGRRRLSSLIFS